MDTKDSKKLIALLTYIGEELALIRKALSLQATLLIGEENITDYKFASIRGVMSDISELWETGDNNEEALEDVLKEEKEDKGPEHG
jgi:hypothetical protein